ncbi:MAG: helix-turn-helix domain-containing protein [Clostridiales bacterium]|jgi:transcriptional regulator with XRE-family HTH domain|nr:helix-turn-helix domain-containing protein [Clostridiales bacterium]
MNIEIANRLVTLRKQFNLSREELAERLSISRQAVSRWEMAEESPDAENLLELSKLYGVTVDSLLAPEMENNHAYQTRPADLRNESSISYTAGRVFASDDMASALKFFRRLAPVYPVIISMIYLILGFLFGLWHPSWIIFLTIPIFYVMIR